MQQLLYTITETLNMLLPLINFLKCVFIEVLFSVVFKTLHILRDSVATQFMSGEIFNDSNIANFLQILTVK